MARVVVDVMLKPEILDPQGQAVQRALPRLGFDGVSDVRQESDSNWKLTDRWTTPRSPASMILRNPSSPTP